MEKLLQDPRVLAQIWQQIAQIVPQQQQGPDNPVPGQQLMGQYLRTQQAPTDTNVEALEGMRSPRAVPTTEQELEMVQQLMSKDQSGPNQAIPGLIPGMRYNYGFTTNGKEGDIPYDQKNHDLELQKGEDRY